MNKIVELIDRRLVKFILLAFSGILTGLTVCFPAIGVLEWISLIPAFVVMLRLCTDGKHKLVSVYFYGLFFYMCYFVTAWHWFFSMYPLDFTELGRAEALAVILLAVLGIPLIQSLSFALTFLFSSLLSKTTAVKKFPLMLPFAVAALWTVLEWSETLFWIGVPWARLSIGQTELLTQVQSASLFGCYFVTFLLVAVNCLAAYALLFADVRKLCVTVAASLLIGNTLFGAVSLFANSMTDLDSEPIRVAVIQGNISSTEKWGEDWYSVTVTKYVDLIDKAAGDGAELVILPETVFPIYIEDSVMTQELLSKSAKGNNITILVGTMTRDENNRQRNIVIVIDAEGEIHYDNYYSKRHLVPFGEYVPHRDLLTVLFPPLANISMLSDDIVPGDSASVYTNEKYSVGAAICFDSIYESLLRDSANSGAEILSISTNDSWFSDSAGVYMHEAQAKLRAIETGRYVLRAANTGVSAIISPTGKAIAEIEPLVDGYAVENVYARSGATLYSTVGNVYVLVCFAFSFGILLSEPIIGILRRRTYGEHK